MSLLTAFSKLIEQIMYTKVMSFLSRKTILYEHRHGFQTKQSSIHPVIHLINHCAKVNNAISQKYTMSILYDISKAFDIINNGILLKLLLFEEYVVMQINGL